MVNGEEVDLSKMNFKARRRYILQKQREEIREKWKTTPEGGLVGRMFIRYGELDEGDAIPEPDDMPQGF